MLGSKTPYDLALTSAILSFVENVENVGWALPTDHVQSKQKDF
jgi:hypothetical protein